MARARSRSRARRRRSSLRSIVVVACIFTGISLLVLLVVPPWGRVGAQVRQALYGSAGFLSFLLPALLLMCAVRTLSASALRGGFTTILGTGVTGYFLAALTDMVGSRFNPAIAGRPGGLLAHSTVELLEKSAGSLVAYLILLACLITALVIFTGWDLADDLLLLGRAAKSAAPKPRARPGRDGETPAPPAPPPFMERHAWDRPERQDTPPIIIQGLADSDRDLLPEIAGSAPVLPPADSADRFPARSAAPAREPLKERAEEPVRAPGSPEGALSAGLPAVQAFTSRATLPKLDMLEAPSRGAPRGVPESELLEKAALLEKKLADFGVSCRVTGHRAGPVLTRFELKPGQGVRVNSILGLSDDLALALKAKRIRILAPIPGRDAVGVEVPNSNPEPVFLSEILQAVPPGVKLPLALGKKLEGEPFVTDLTEAPHLLVAGATGSGKSVSIHSMICTLLMTRKPEQVRLALVDPKRVELAIYEDVPHLWAPVIVDPKKARQLLESLVVEMDNRYRTLEKARARTIDEFNTAPPPDAVPMPYIVLFIDELYDLMQTSGNEVELPICRLAQKARAVGIHLVVATQRPSVDVITGVIKANFPSRIAFNVMSKTDSRTILDANGAEKLLGRGDMLFLQATSSEPIRIHGSNVSTSEARSIVEFWKDQALKTEHGFSIREGDPGNTPQAGDVKADELLDTARDLVINSKTASVTFLQKKLGLGYPRAARLIELLQEEGVIGPFQGGKRREVYGKRDETPRGTEEG
jgi:DNA segregation ATPase FtsK/SpoIIIE-like protein